MASQKFCTIPMKADDFQNLTLIAKKLDISRAALVRKCIRQMFAATKND